MSKRKEAIELAKKLPICAEYQYKVEELIALLRAEEPEAREFTKRFRRVLSTVGKVSIPCPERAYKQFGEEACDIIDSQAELLRNRDEELSTWIEGYNSQAAEIKAKDEKFNMLANQVVDMSLAIIGWREKLSFENEGELIDALERMINEAVK